VIRGEDHISNTPKQILILNALGKEPPIFAHISLLYGKDGRIMSKRDAASNIKYYKEEGYLPEAVLNYLAVTGNTFTLFEYKNGKKEIFEKEIFSNILEMADLLDIKKAKGSSAIFSEDKLRHINEKQLTLMPAEQLIKVLTEKFQAASLLTKLKEEYGEGFSLEIIDFIKNEFKTVKEILKELEIFFDDFKINLSGMKYDDGLRKVFLESFQSMNDFNENSIKNIVKETALKNGKTAKECYETLRLFLTGKLDGPSILKIIRFLGKDRVVKRLHNYV
jgi:nondiscriminating glutamyl-tRNA synthetase